MFFSLSSNTFLYSGLLFNIFLLFCLCLFLLQYHILLFIRNRECQATGIVANRNRGCSVKGCCLWRFGRIVTMIVPSTPNVGTDRVIHNMINNAFLMTLLYILLNYCLVWSIRSSILNC